MLYLISSLTNSLYYDKIILNTWKEKMMSKVSDIDIESLPIISQGQKISLSDFVNTKPIDEIYDLAQTIQQMIDENKKFSFHEKFDGVLDKASKVLVVIGAVAIIICPFFDGVTKSALLGMGLANVGIYGISKLTEPNENVQVKKANIQLCKELLVYINEAIQRREEEADIFPDVLAY